MLSFIPDHIRGYVLGIYTFIVSAAAPATEESSVAQDQPPEKGTIKPEHTDALSLVSTTAEERDRQLAKHKQKTEDLLAQFRELQERQALLQRRALIADRKRALHAATHSAARDLLERYHLTRGQAVNSEDSLYIIDQMKKVWLLAHSTLPHYPPPPPNVNHAV